MKPILDHVVISPNTGIYVNQSDKGEFVFGGALDLYTSYGQRGTFPTIEHVVAGCVEMFPAFGHLRLMRHWAGLVDVSPDSSPIIGATPIDNLFINCGWGTGGFKATPAGGYMLAHAVARARAACAGRPLQPRSLSQQPAHRRGCRFRHRALRPRRAC